MLLGSQEKLFAAADGDSIQAKNPLNQRIGIALQAICGAHVGDETNLQRLSRSNTIAKQDQRESKAGQGVLAQVGHDGGWREAGTHFRKAQGCGFSHQDKIADDSEPKTEAKRISLNFRHTDQGQHSQTALDLNQAPGFMANAVGVAAGALASRTEDIASRSDMQHSRPRALGFRAQLRQHGIEHGAGNLIPILGIVQRETENVSCALNDQPGGGWSGRGTFLSRHARHGIRGNKAMSTSCADRYRKSLAYLPKVIRYHLPTGEK